MKKLQNMLKINFWTFLVVGWLIVGVGREIQIDKQESEIATVLTAANITITDLQKEAEYTRELLLRCIDIAQDN